MDNLPNSQRTLLKDTYKLESLLEARIYLREQERLLEEYASIQDIIDNTELDFENHAELENALIHTLQLLEEIEESISEEYNNDPYAVQQDLEANTIKITSLYNYIKQHDANFAENIILEDLLDDTEQNITAYAEYHTAFIKISPQNN
jgi:hypothetical protein